MQPSNILAIDYGRRHLGLAVSLDNNLPLALTTLSGDFSEISAALAKIVTENSINLIVVGLPQSQTHGSGQAQEILDFIKKLNESLPGVAIETFDEKMTSKMARRYADPEKEHQEAARIILEDWQRRN